MFTLSVCFFALGCFASWLVTFVCRQLRIGQSDDSEPQYHHTNTEVIPRIGGIGIIVGFTSVYLLSFLFLNEGDDRTLIHVGIFLGACAAFVLGIIDDFRPLGAKFKLLIQLLIGYGAYLSGLTIDQIGLPFTDSVIQLGSLGVFISVFWIVALMNLINLIDGLDGLAGGVGLMLMVLLGFLALSNGVVISMVLSFGMVGAILGFLFHNFPPAKVYMGDSGAYAIGYVIASVSLLNAEKGTILAALFAPILALALPIIDVSYAMVRRSVNGLPIFRPDQGHIHHRLMQSGLSRQKTVLCLYGFSLFALVGGLLVFANQGRYLPIFIGFAFVIVLFTLKGQRITPGLVRTQLVNSLQARSDTKNALYLRDWLIVEAERADTGAHLWSDFRFILKKVGVCRATLTINGVERTFFQTNTPHDQPDRLLSQEREVCKGTLLNVSVDRDQFSEQQFHLIADIVAEAWAKASANWRKVNAAPLDFNAVALEPTHYRQQKARALYRPTY